MFTGTVSTAYWWSTPVADASDSFYSVSFGNGGINIGEGAVVTIPVRCVR